MRSIYPTALALLENKEPFVLATVIRTWGSAPRKAGSHMLIWAEQMLGSVSGGCVEGDVFQKAQDLLRSDRGALINYGVSDEDAWNVGLSCGGKIDVLLESFSHEREEDHGYWSTIRDAFESDLGGVIVHPMSGEVVPRTAIRADSLRTSEAHVVEAFYKRSHAIHAVEGQESFIEILEPRHKLIIIGAAHIATELVHLAKQFDFEVSIIDPRGFYTDKTMFQTQPDHIYPDWPAEVLEKFSLTPYTYAVVLSHDPKIDDQALEILLNSEVAYIGALGSKKTHAKRVGRLQAAGFTEEQIEKIHAPVGVDIHAQSAKEIALSILADLIMEKNKYI